MKFISKLVYLFSGEFLLINYPNGGTVVLLRSILASLTLFILFICICGILETGIGTCIDFDLVHKLVSDKIEYWGAIFAGCYTAFYARFSSQWSYLADVYNQLMVSLVQTPPDSNQDRIDAYALWKAGIVEDAYNLHLAAKPMFAPLIAGLLEDKNVVQCFKESAVNGEYVLIKLKAQLTQSLNREIKFGIK